MADQTNTPHRSQECDVSGCDHPAVVLLANDAPLLSEQYREWYACRWHRRNDTISADSLDLPILHNSDADTHA